MSSGKWKLKQQFCISIRMAKIQNPDNTNCWQRCGVSGTLIHCWQEHKVVQPFWSSVRQALHKAQHALTIWSSNCSLCYLPKRAENLHPQEKIEHLLWTRLWGRYGTEQTDCCFTLWRMPSLSPWTTAGLPGLVKTWGSLAIYVSCWIFVCN